MDTIQQLISGYLDNELDDQQVDRLATILQTDVLSLDDFILDNVIHSQLLDLMDEKRLQDKVIGEIDSDDACRDLLSRSSSIEFDDLRKPAPIATRTSVAPRRALRPIWGALAATVLVAASIALMSYVASSRPAYVGTLTEATAARWGAAPANIAVGTFLEDNQALELLSGTAVITFSNGARLYFEGPTSLQLNSPKDVRLTRGHVAAKIPRPAVGFTVHSALADFVDLGTAFELTLEAEKTFQLHVFEGLVEVRLNERFGNAAQRPARIAEVLAVKFDVESGDIEKLPFEEGKQMPF
jgi:ferric-dicitrate binding protein FerR (iron transport regulator)